MGVVMHPARDIGESSLRLALRVFERLQNNSDHASYTSAISLRRRIVDRVAAAAGVLLSGCQTDQSWEGDLSRL
jgi:hypothetical protein